MEDLRGTVQSLLQSQLEDSNGFLHRESWIRVLRDIGGTEQEAQAVLQEIPNAQMSVEQFLDILFSPQRCYVSRGVDSTAKRQHHNDKQPEGILREALPRRRKILSS